MAKRKKIKKLNNKIQNQKIIKFDILNEIDLENEYDLTIVSFCIAYNDLIHIHKEMIQRSSRKYMSYRLYLLKIATSQLREAYWLIEKSFYKTDDVGKRINGIPGAREMFERIVDRIDGLGDESFAKKVLFAARNMTLHYGFKNVEDKQLLIKIAQEMHDDLIPGAILLGESQVDTYFEFADSLFINSLVTLGENYGLNEKEYFSKLGNLVAEVVALLEWVIMDYFMEKPKIKEQIQK
jgi:hypothetical protein